MKKAYETRFLITGNLTWWEKLLLFFKLFKPTQVSIDYCSSKDKTVKLYWKRLFGKFYVVNEEII